MFWLEAVSGKAAFSPPAHPRVWGKRTPGFTDLTCSATTFRMATPFSPTVRIPNHAERGSLLICFSRRRLYTVYMMVDCFHRECEEINFSMRH
jgi:hypothetical protein